MVKTAKKAEMTLYKEFDFGGGHIGFFPPMIRVTKDVGRWLILQKGLKDSL